MIARSIENIVSFSVKLNLSEQYTCQQTTRKAIYFTSNSTSDTSISAKIIVRTIYSCSSFIYSLCLRAKIEIILIKSTMLGFCHRMHSDGLMFRQRSRGVEQRHHLPCGLPTCKAAGALSSSAVACYWQQLIRKYSPNPLSCCCVCWSISSK